MEVTKILRCPNTGNKLLFNDADSVVAVEDSPTTYPITDGIVDFCPEVDDRISTSYDRFASGYDAYIAGICFPGRPRPDRRRVAQETVEKPWCAVRQGILGAGKARRANRSRPLTEAQQSLSPKGLPPAGSLRCALRQSRTFLPPIPR